MQRTTFTTPTGTTTSTHPHGTVSTSTSPTGSTTSITHVNVSNSTSPTGTKASTTPHGNVSTFTTPTGTTTRTTPQEPILFLLLLHLLKQVVLQMKLFLLFLRLQVLPRVLFRMELFPLSTLCMKFQKMRLEQTTRRRV